MQASGKANEKMAAVADADSDAEPEASESEFEPDEDAQAESEVQSKHPLKQTLYKHKLAIAPCFWSPMPAWCRMAP